MGRLVVDEHRRRVSRVLAAAEQLTGRSREEIDDWIRETPEAVPLLVRVLQAAGNSGNDQTLQMLGEALGRTQKDPKSRPLQELIVMSIEGLTQEHLYVLAACTTDAQPTDAVSKGVEGEVSAELVPLMLTSLHTRGLFINPYGRFGGGEYWQLSELGVAVRDAALVAFPQSLQGEDTRTQ